MAHVAEAARGTIFLHARWWYTGSNVEGRPEVFMP